MALRRRRLPGWVIAESSRVFDLRMGHWRTATRESESVLPARPKVALLSPADLANRLMNGERCRVGMGAVGVRWPVAGYYSAEEVLPGWPPVPDRRRVIAQQRG
jgi:hypothetical protein